MGEIPMESLNECDIFDFMAKTTKYTRIKLYELLTGLTESPRMSHSESRLLALLEDSVRRDLNVSFIRTI